MSETIEERYENLRKWVEKKKSRYPYVSVETSAVMPLLDDLMAERGKMKEKIKQLERDLERWDNDGHLYF